MRDNNGGDSPDRTEPIERITAPLRVFAAHKLAGGVLLLLVTAVAIAWANSPWAGMQSTLLKTVFTFSAGNVALGKPLLLWINDGLMGIFFFLVGLEIKRELLAGELASFRRAFLPIAAAVGGMVVPALLYLALNPVGPNARGWGIPMATDIAFALGALTLIGPRVPTGLKVFLTAVAIVDDIGAVIVIAVFYTDTITFFSLAIGGALFLLSLGANFAGVRSPFVYFLLGALVWLAFLKSGVHATLAAVLMAITIPARTRIDGTRFVTRMGSLLESLRRTGLPSGRKLLTSNQHHLLEEMEHVIDHATAPLQRLEHELVPLVTFLVMPVFALANAGVQVGEGLLDALTDPVALGIILGLFVGKQVGIFVFSWLAVRLGWADLPAGVSWRQVHAVGVLAGIGFTMSLFIEALAFTEPRLQAVAKTGVLSASLISAILGWALLALACRRPAADG